MTSVAMQKEWKHPRLWGIGTALGVGLLKELADSRKGGSGFSGSDLAYDGIGAISIQFTFRIKP
jgi:uncharacterized protein YfiM (DUF2279 family)